MAQDRRSAADQKPPPTTLAGVLGHLGPGLIISGSIVGSGELIVTTRLGAQVGFTLLWLIVLSCVIKVFLQIELGRYAISSGEATLEAFDRMPGPRVVVSWLVWCWFLMALCTLVQLSGILFTTADIFLVERPGPSGPAPALPDWPGGPKTLWLLLIAGLTAALLASGRYRLVERSTTSMVFVFTATSIVAGLALQATGIYSVRLSDVAHGLSFGLPREEGGLLIGVAAFGITGVGASELVWYPYWCLEKGYGRFAGPSTGAGWEERARGWVRVMQIDAWVSLVVYTAATVSFYFLGAAVLNRDYLAGRGVIPGNEKMLETLSAMYTSTLGQGAGWWIFLAGALAVLYSTFFVATASNARLLADMAHVTGLFRLREEASRRRAVKVLCVSIPLFCFLVQASVPQPMDLILVGGIAQFCMLPLIALGAVYLRYRHTDPRLAPRRLSDLFLWIAFATMFALGIYKAFEEIHKRL